MRRAPHFTDGNGLVFSLTQVVRKGPTAYSQLTTYSVFSLRPSHVAEHVKPQPYRKEPVPRTVPSAAAIE